MVTVHSLRGGGGPRFLKEGFWILLGQAGVVVGMLVGVRILTDFLSPAAYGELALGMTLATLVGQTITGPLANGITRFFAPALERGELGAYLGASRRLVLLAATIATSLIPTFLVGLWVGGWWTMAPLVFASLVFAVLRGANSILNGIQNAARQRATVALHQGMDPWARFLVAAGLMLLLGATSTVAMVGYVLATILVLGSQYLFFHRIAAQAANQGGDPKSWQREITNFSWPFMAWGVFTWAQQASDRWALGLLRSTEEVGLYAVLFQMGYFPITMVSGLAVTFLAPILFHRAGDASDPQRRAEVTNLSWWLAGLVLAVTAVAFALGLALHRQVFQILVDQEYWDVSYLLPWVLLYGGIFASGQALSLDLLSQMRTKSMIVMKIVSSIMGLGFNFVGAFYLGIPGIVIAGMSFAIVHTAWVVVLVKRNPPGLSK